MVLFELICLLDQVILGYGWMERRNRMLPTCTVGFYSICREKKHSFVPLITASYYKCFGRDKTIFSKLFYTNIM